MRIALAQINPTVGDLEGNAGLIKRYADEAFSQGAEIVVFPELAISGYPPEDLVLKDYFVNDCRQALLNVAASCPDLVMLVGVPLQENHVVYNAAAVLSGGSVAGWYRKILLPNYAVFDEKRYFAQGDRVVILETGSGRLGITICEDIWEEHGPAEVAAIAGGAGIILNLSMSPYHLGKGREREEMLSRRAKDARAYVCYVNGVGGQDELVFDGHSLVLDPEGRVVARGAQFKEQLLVVNIDGGNDPFTDNESDRFGSPLDERSEAPDGSAPDSAVHWPAEVIRVLPRSNQAETPRSCKAGALIDSGVTAAITLDAQRLSAWAPLCVEAEVYAALCLGVKDYALKNGFKQVVIGISGGIDSALTACVAADALGVERVNTVSMPSRYSSEGTKSDARETAERLGVRYYEIPIEGIFEAYLAGLSPYLDERSPGVAEQNIQARIRGNLLMALSNRFGWLVITTGNKSEIAVGYATLYGDMAGGFAALKDVPKTLVYRVASYRNSLGPGDGPIPRTTLERAPSAELAPGQTDQDTLPPYDILDRIIEGYVVNDDSLDEIVAMGIDRAVVQRVLAMIDGNEYKRRQGAPGVRISPKGFGKDRRLPITNRYRG